MWAHFVLALLSALTAVLLRCAVMPTYRKYFCSNKRWSPSVLAARSLKLDGLHRLSTADATPLSVVPSPSPPKELTSSTFVPAHFLILPLSISWGVRTYHAVLKSENPRLPVFNLFLSGISWNSEYRSLTMHLYTHNHALPHIAYHLYLLL